MSAFAIVTDSASDISRAALERFGIHVVPMHVVVRGRDHLDGVDIDAAEVLGLARAAREELRTSHPMVAEFARVYSQLIAEGHTRILSIHISSELSSTVEIAQLMAGNMPQDVTVEVVDSRSASVGEGAQVLAAAAIAEAGGSMEDAIARVHEIRESASICFIPYGYASLVRGGRVRAAQGIISTILNFKPIAELTQDGRIEVIHRAKGMRSAVAYVARRLARRSQALGELIYFKLHIRGERALHMMEKPLETNELEGTCAGTATVGASVAAHVGAGAIGVFSYPTRLHNPSLKGEEMFLSPGV